MKEDMAKKACKLWVEENKAKLQEDKKNDGNINTDVFGSYTGVHGEDPCEVPEQDADDL